jgi:hypothetical protein
VLLLVLLLQLVGLLGPLLCPLAHLLLGQALVVCQ